MDPFQVHQLHHVSKVFPVDSSSSGLIPLLDLRHSTGQRETVGWQRLQLSFLSLKQGENDIMAVQLR